MRKVKQSFRRGTEIVEMAILLPLLLILVLGAIQYGWLFLNWQQVTNASRQGARIAILPYANATTDATTAINNLLLGAALNDDTPTVAIIPTTVGGRAGFRVQVTVSTGKLNFVGSLLPIPATLGCTVTMAQES